MIELLLILTFIIISFTFTITIYKQKMISENELRDIYVGGYREVKRAKSKPKPKPKSPASTPAPKKEEVKFVEGSDYWKYSVDVNDIECLKNWNYYDSSNKIIKENIKSLTDLNKSNLWCASTTNNPVNQLTPNQESIILNLTDNDNALLVNLLFSGIQISQPILVAVAKKIGMIKFNQLANITDALKSVVKNSLRSAAKLRLLFNKSAIKLLLIPKISFKLQAKSIMSLAKLIDINTLKTIVKNLGKALAISGLKAPGKLLRLAKSLKPGPMLIFDLFNAGLDIVDPLKYNSTYPKKDLYKMKSEYDKEFKQAVFNDIQAELKKQNIDLKIEDFEWPIVYDPIEEMITDEILENRFEEMMATIDTDNPDKHIAPVIDKVQADIDSGVITMKDLDDDELMDKNYYSLIDTDAILLELMTELCNSKSGTMQDKTCKITKRTCDLAYTWPLGENDTLYTEYSEKYGCIMANPQMRIFCDSNNLAYDATTGICKITEQYCKEKGLNWEYNTQLGEDDCALPITQLIAEVVTGVTFTRVTKRGTDIMSKMFAPLTGGGIQDGMNIVSGAYFDTSKTSADVFLPPPSNARQADCWDIGTYTYELDNKLLVNEILRPCTGLIIENGDTRYIAALTNNGNLVVYNAKTNELLWESKTSSKYAILRLEEKRLVLYSNLVLYKPYKDGTVLWEIKMPSDKNDTFISLDLNSSGHLELKTAKLAIPIFTTEGIKSVTMRDYVNTKLITDTLNSINLGNWFKSFGW